MLASGLHWTPETISKLTDTQICLWNHALWVNEERREEKSRRDRTCRRCGQETISNEVCSNCKYRQPSNKTRHSGGGDVFIWKSPSTGRFYKFVGDEFESGVMKFKNHCMQNKEMKIYSEYCGQVGIGARL